MPISADQFLSALALPSEHPYIKSAHNDDAVDGEAGKKWSISSYFSSVAWEKDSSAETFEESMSAWAVWPLTFVDASGGGSNATIANNNITPDFWHEVKPCLIAMAHLNILLWAPIILLLCLKKIYLVHRRDDATNEDVTPPLLQSETGCSSESCSSMQTMLSSAQLVAMPTMPTLPSLRNKATITAHNNNKQVRQAAETYSFERLLLLLSLFVSALASYKAVFSVVEDKKEKSKDEPNSGQFKERKYYQCSRSDSNVSLSQGPFTITTEWLAYLVALVLTALLVNDSMYVMEFGQRNLLALHLFVITVSLKRFGTKTSLATCIPITVIALYIMVNTDLDLPTIKPGLYHDENNKYISNIVKEWPVDKRTYDRGTPWMLTGDVRTGLPFMVNNIPEQKYVRRWVPLPDEEAVILDIAFPDSMTIEDGKRVYLVLHGINGNSNEGYVVDFVHQQVSQGNVVAVMVSRGFGDSQVLGDNILHFSRISDVGAAARALRTAINRVSERGLLLAGVGYSMGGITLANYVSQVNPPDLDAAIVFSAALDTKEQVNFQRSASLWQPFIAKAMRDNMLSRFSRQIHDKLDENQMKNVMRASTMVDLDRDLFVPYHGYESLEDYYSHMGAMGDFDINGYEGRMRNISIPLLCVQALDDPVGYWKTFHDPERVARGNTLILFTRTGGHVGWPLSVNPSAFGWSWMSDVASSFAESVDLVRTKINPC